MLKFGLHVSNVWYWYKFFKKEWFISCFLFIFWIWQCRLWFWQLWPETFDNCHKYKIAQILLYCFNPLFSLFTINLIFIGILYASCGAYWALKMYNKVNIVLYLCGPSLSVICFIIAIEFTRMFGQLSKNLESFKRVWLTKHLSSEEKRVVFSLKSCGFRVGPYRIVTKKLGILICDDIICSTVSAFLLDSS